MKEESIIHRQAEYVRFDGVSFAYQRDEQTVISNYSFQINSGEKVAIQGKSGTGKSTLFRLLLGFEWPSKGRILVNQKEINPHSVQQLRQQTAWLPQEMNLGEGVVGEVIDFLFQFKYNKKLQKKADSILPLLPIVGLQNNLMQKNLAEISAGQRQRVGLLVCYLLDRPLILLDEPSSALDEEAKTKVAKLFFNDPEKTVISISHDPWWIERCNRTLQLQD